MIIYTSGVFDLFHYGHMKLLNKCKELFPNSIFYVGVHSDKDVESYKRKPIMTMEERIKSIETYGIIDKIIKNAPLLETKEFYNLHKIDIILHAHSQQDNKYYIEKFYKYAYEKKMFRRLDYTSDISTTELINRIKLKYNLI